MVNVVKFSPESISLQYFGVVCVNMDSYLSEIRQVVQQNLMKDVKFAFLDNKMNIVNPAEEEKLVSKDVMQNQIKIQTLSVEGIYM